MEGEMWRLGTKSYGFSIVVEPTDKVVRGRAK
jgi:hypothetical protein